jgi:hypothetical protein
MMKSTEEKPIYGNKGYQKFLDESNDRYKFDFDHHRRNLDHLHGFSFDPTEGSHNYYYDDKELDLPTTIREFRSLEKQSRGPYLRSESPFGDMRRRGKLFINDKLFTIFANDQKVEKAYNSLTEHYKQANPVQKQTLAMLLNNLIDDDDFKGINFYEKSESGGKNRIRLGLYDPKTKKANVYIGQEGAPRSPISLANHEMLHARMDDSLQEKRNPGVDRSNLPSKTLETYYDHISKDISLLPTEVIEDIGDAQKVIDPTEDYYGLYPAENIDLFSNGYLRKGKDENVKINSPEEFATHALERIGDKQEFVLSKNERANSIARRVIENTKNELGRLHEKGFQDYPLIEAAFNKSLEQFKKSSKPQKLDPKDQKEYAGGGYVSSSSDPYMNTYGYPYNSFEPYSLGSYLANQIPDPQYNMDEYNDPDLSYGNVYDTDGQQYAFREGGSVREKELPRLAEVLQRYGRNGDTILAHINPMEAQLLRSIGGKWHNKF